MDTEKKRISLKSLFSSFSDFWTINTNVQIIIALVFGALVIAFIFLKFYKSTSQKRAVALLGLCGSGKTQLFSQLCYGVNVLSVTSVKESSGYFTLNSFRRVMMFDIPGHERIRYNLFDKVKHQLKALMFVIDASEIQENIRDVAEYLYTLLCDETVQTGRPNILIICNKQDLPYAKGMSVIQSILEKEINLLRVTKSKELKSVGDKENNNSFLGNPNEDFKFSHLKPIKIFFAETVSTDKSQTNSIKKWLDNIM